jgi:hemolysin III
MKMENAEQFNVLTSLAGVVAAVTGVAVLVPPAFRQGDPWKVVSFGIYGLSLLSLYTHATLYHLLSGKVKQVFKELDHDSIFILIAGTYTPFSLVTLRGVWGWTLFGLVWGGALIGIAKERWPGLLPRVPEMAIFLLMGWLVLIAIVPLVRALPLPGVGFLLLGGLFYTGGIFFYLLDNRIAWFHGLWHLCVLAGSICHYLAVCLFIA